MAQINLSYEASDLCSSFSFFMSCTHVSLFVAPSVGGTAKACLAIRNDSNDTRFLDLGLDLSEQLLWALAHAIKTSTDININEIIVQLKGRNSNK